MADEGEQASVDGNSHRVSSEAQVQASGEEPYFPDLKLGNAWGESITKRRADELEARLQAWQGEADHGKRKGPFDEASLAGADVFWLAARTLAGTSETQGVLEQMERLRQVTHDLMFQLATIPTKVKPMRQVIEDLVYQSEFRLDRLHLEGANLSFAHLEGSTLWDAHLEGADLSYARLEGAVLSRAHLERTDFTFAHLERADIKRAHLEGSTLWDAHLEGADLSYARLEGADLSRAHLERTDFFEAHLERAYLFKAHLGGSDFFRSTFDNQTELTRVVLTDTPHWYSLFLRRLRRKTINGAVRLADVHWNGADLTVADWSGVRRLGNERSKKWWWRTLFESGQAARANTQLAKQLRDAGMNDDADRFAYRAQVCQRGVHLLRLRFGRWLFSWLLFVVAGYGYRPLRTLFWYLAVIFGFAFLYMHFGHVGGHPFEFDEALVFSVTSFHGRGFFPGTLDLKDLVTKLAASEAVFGLFIEVSFIATFTQRYFGK